MSKSSPPEDSYLHWHSILTAIITTKEANRELSDFDKNIIKAINYNPKEGKK